MNGNGEMSNCPFLAVTGVCQMGISEHIFSWQSMFTEISIKETFFIIFFSFFIIFLLRNVRHFHKIPSIADRSAFFRSEPPPLFNILKEAFSRGILHPKIF
ncbi:hypothetical protein HY249_02335 [Candidatus Azambacteria bacterium]|nr:hypothetical protein [Candidatus Azambacteria bacterium]